MCVINPLYIPSTIKINWVFYYSILTTLQLYPDPQRWVLKKIQWCIHDPSFLFLLRAKKKEERWFIYTTKFCLRTHIWVKWYVNDSYLHLNLPGCESLESIDQICCLVSWREIIQLNHMTKLININGWITGLKRDIIYLWFLYLYSSNCLCYFWYDLNNRN